MERALQLILHMDGQEYVWDNILALYVTYKRLLRLQWELFLVYKISAEISQAQI